MKVQSDIFGRYPLSSGSSDSQLAAEIRLARIFPSYFSNYHDASSPTQKTSLDQDSDALVVTLETTSLQRIRDKDIHFIVLSFEHNDPTPTDDHGLDLVNITVCGAPFAVPQALKSALLAGAELVGPHEYSLLWVDFLCVDLRASKERCSQRALMGFIYAHAHSIVRWETEWSIDRIFSSVPSSPSLRLRRSEGKNLVHDALIPDESILRSDLWDREGKSDKEQSTEPHADKEATLAGEAESFRCWADWYVKVVRNLGHLEVGGSEVQLDEIHSSDPHDKTLQAFSKNANLLMDIALDGTGKGLERV